MVLRKKWDVSLLLFAGDSTVCTTKGADTSEEGQDLVTESESCVRSKFRVNETKSGDEV